MQDFKYLFYLSNVEGLGVIRMRKLLAHFGSAENIFSSTVTEIKNIDGFSNAIASCILNSKKNFKEYETRFSILQKNLEKNSTGVVLYSDELYPELLKNIYDPPLYLFYKGNLSRKNVSLLNNSIAIVGTRKPTEYGKHITETISIGLAQKGISIISGFARGVDTIAHSSVLNYADTKCITAAVLGCGIDVIYPPENRKLYSKMIESGIFFSEYEIGSPPDAINFPRRNRIISGISHGVVIIESGQEGGALITARCALDQSREVFAVPGDVRSKFSKGTNNLIKNGNAKLIDCIDDIIQELKYNFPSLNFDKDGKPDRSEKKNLHLKGNEKIIDDFLSKKFEAVHIDEISEETGLNISDCLISLLNLEFKSIVKQLPGKRFLSS